jgi:PPOX class probable F420-dependent enzyme
LAEFDAERLAKFLRPARIAVLATVGSDGTPQVTPVWYGYEDGRLTVAANENSAKVRNLRRDPRLSVCVYEGERGAEYAALYGRADLAHGDGVWPQVRSIVERYESPENVDEYMRELMAERFAIITLAPERVLFGP